MHGDQMTINKEEFKSQIANLRIGNTSDLILELYNSDVDMHEFIVKTQKLLTQLGYECFQNGYAYADQEIRDIINFRETVYYNGIIEEGNHENNKILGRK